MRSAGILVLFLAFTALAAAQNRPYGPVEPGPEDRLIRTFQADPSGTREFTFRWAFHADSRDETIVCSLNLDGDNVNEVTIENCDDDREYSHRYDDEGAHTVTLTARSRDGGSDVARVVIEAR